MTEERREPVLEFKNVGVSYGLRTILEGVSFSLRPGEFSYLIGKTGAGKSTILKLIYADANPNAGDVFVGGKSNRELRKREIPFLRRKLGIVFQDYQLLPDLSVFENIAFAMRSTGWTGKAKIRNRVAELLHNVGLSTKEKALPHQLSGGEQQRVTIARALVNDPILLLGDEPTGNLDPEATEKIMEILLKINLGGTAVLMATHELNLIKKFPARTLEVSEGGIIDHELNFNRF